MAQYKVRKMRKAIKKQLQQGMGTNTISQTDGQREKGFTSLTQSAKKRIAEENAAQKELRLENAKRTAKRRYDSQTPTKRQKRLEGLRQAAQI